MRDWIATAALTGHWQARDLFESSKQYCDNPWWTQTELLDLLNKPCVLTPHPTPQQSSSPLNDEIPMPSHNGVALCNEDDAYQLGPGLQWAFMSHHLKTILALQI